MSATLSPRCGFHYRGALDAGDNPDADGNTKYCDKGHAPTGSPDINRGDDDEPVEQRDERESDVIDIGHPPGGSAAAPGSPGQPSTPRHVGAEGEQTRKNDLSNDGQARPVRNNRHAHERHETQKPCAVNDEPLPSRTRIEPPLQ